MDVLRRHNEAGDIEIDPDEIELAAEHFLALVEALPMRLAEFGVYRRHTSLAERIPIRRLNDLLSRLMLMVVVPSGLQSSDFSTPK